ncbi:MAG: hypothetical protein AABZ53_17835 [Planctomycetota bacterium]
MKPVLAWVKANLLVVIFSALIVISLPTGFYFSAAWAKDTREKRSKLANDKLRSIDEQKIRYQIPPVMPNGKPVEDPRSPSLLANSHYQAERARIDKLAKGVTGVADAFNRGEGKAAADVGRKPHVALIDGLFPKPSDPRQASILTSEFVALLVDQKGRPSVYTTMLRDILNAGGPVDPVILGSKLTAERNSQIQRLTGNDPNRKVTPEEQKTLEETLIAFRRNQYLQRASEISVYAGLDIFPIETAQGGASGGSTIPGQVPSEPPGVSRTFQWQMDYWMIRDLLFAVRAANLSSGGSQLHVNESVIKRVDKIRLLEPFAGRPASTGGEDPNAAPTPPTITVDALTGLVPMDVAWSVTGRKNSPGNPLYDVRLAELELVVSASRLKQIFDAFGRTNLMTIIDVDLKAVDVMGELDRGYYFGNESVVKATITVETIWLRSWTEKMFPSGVRKRLGLALPEGEKADDADMASGSGGGPSSMPEDMGGGNTPGEPFINPKSRAGQRGGGG